MDRQWYFDRLISLEMYEDEIPEEMVNGNSNNLRRKVRVNWFNGITGCASTMALEGYLSSRSSSILGQFNRYLEESNFKNRPKNEDDIKRGQKLFDSLIMDLKESKE